MKQIPKWIYRALAQEQVKCQDCNHIFVDNNIVAVGIRSSIRKPGTETLFIELMCFRCNSAIMFELQEMSLVGLAYEILDDHKNKNKKNDKEKDSLIKNIKENNMLNDKKDLYNSGGNPPHRKSLDNGGKTRSKITRAEVEDSVKFLDSIESHDDLLMAMGMSPEEIDMYKIVDEEEEDN